MVCDKLVNNNNSDWHSSQAESDDCRRIASVRLANSSLIFLIISIFMLFAPKAIGAERLSFNFSPFGQFYIKVDDLEAFATEGEISSELAYYLNRMPPKQVARLPELLSTPLELHPLSIAKFSNSTIGKAVIKNFGKGIRVDNNRNGFFALRGAIIAAVFEREGLTVMNFLHQFPSKTIYVDLQVLEQYVEHGNILFEDREAIDQAFFLLKTKTFNHTYESESTELSKPQTQGKFIWNQLTLTYKNPRRRKVGHFDLYLPEVEQPTPLIVISHGLASNRQTFAYLGKHLASHGFAVAVIEHDDISLNKFDGFLSGLERFPEPNNLIDQPLDVKYVLDKLEQESKTNPLLLDKINFQQVGLIGQSFGGYASLALAGGRLIADEIPTKCQKDNYQDVLLDLSSLAQCTVSEIASHQDQLRDPRIKAVIAINPLGKIFGKAGISKIKIPTMLVSGTHDLITPPVAEQIQPFTWLEEIDKYLVLVKPGTHFSFLQEGLGVLPVPKNVVGPSPTSAYPALKGLSTAFFKTHIAQQPEYQIYLQGDRWSELINNDFQLSIIRSLTQNQLEEIIKRQLAD
ncbi:alpha/beta hydrolase [Pleurocapsa sp. PCC 7319]|uniref:alpha/beta hydrolase n=1 Tax=Pleurocapsa sp. PCC 7319 TaxID=118161 RepID=UPI00034BC031|nr:alpha/beta hydrolase [Pleurocapsa sp. PCC 7319]